MITGVVNSQLEPVVPLALRDSAGSVFPIETVVDTGFAGTMTLPLSVINSLGFPWSMRSTYFLGDGSQVYSDTYAGIIIWDGKECQVAVDAAETHPLLGMKLLAGNRVQIDAIVGGSVVIEPLPVTKP